MSIYHAAELGRALFEEAGDALFLFDPETEKLLDVNPMAQRLTQYSRQELLGMQATCLFQSEEPRGVNRWRQAFHKTGVFHSQEGFLLRHKEGDGLPVSLSVTRLPTGTQTLGLITARDIREQRQALDRLRTLEERLRTVIN